MKIENSSQANYYYNHIHDLLKDYTEQWGIKASNLRRYFKKGSKKYKNFLERNNLLGIKGIEVVFNDILDDMSSFEKEYVMKFESFLEKNPNEFSLFSSIKLNLKESDIKMEKFLADFFDTNLSNITLLSPSKHLYNIEDWEEEKKVYIYDLEDIEVINKNLIKYLYNHIIKQEISMIFKIDLLIGDLINFEDFSLKIEKHLTDDKLIEIISMILSSEFLVKKNNYFLWKSNI
jgi:hypothetical protein